MAMPRRYRSPCSARPQRTGSRGLFQYRTNASLLAHATWVDGGESFAWWVDRCQEAVHARGRIVVRESGAVLLVARVEFGSAAGGVGGEGHVSAASRPLSLEPSRRRRSRRAWVLSSHAAWSWKCRISQSSKHGLDIASRMPFAWASLTASSSPGWFRGHSTSNAHQNSSISASSSMALLRASVAVATRVRGTDPPCPVSTRRSTAATSRTDGCRLRALRYSGSVLSPSQKTTSVFRGFRVATFRLSGRAPAPWPLRLILRRWPRGRARAAA